MRPGYRARRGEFPSTAGESSGWCETGGCRGTGCANSRSFAELELRTKPLSEGPTIEGSPKIGNEFGERVGNLGIQFGKNRLRCKPFGSQRFDQGAARR